MDDIDKLRKELVDSETFCFYPFLELSVNPSGHIRPCCYYDGLLYKDVSNINYKVRDYTNVLNIQEHGTTLEDAWYSDNMKLVRKQMYEGTEKDYTPCEICKRDGQSSMRVRSINHYKNNRQVLQLVKAAIDNDFHVESLPQRLELKPSNLCNLKCVMCNSYDSSQIAKELEELSEKYDGITVEAGRLLSVDHAVTTSTQAAYNKNIVSPYDQHIIKIKLENSTINNSITDYSNNEQLWETFCKIVPTLETLSFAGGEPTLIPFVERALSYCVDNGYANNITVFCSTNATNINKKLLSLIPKFKLFEVICSIDGYEKVQEYSRFPSKWPQIEKNYKALKQLTIHPNVKILLNITVTALNVYNLDELLNWIEEQAQEYPYFHQWPYNINMLSHPVYQQASMLPMSIKNKAIARLERYKENSVILKEFPGLDLKIDLVINELRKHNNSDVTANLKLFSKSIQALDEHRGIDIDSYIPALKGVYK
jgi:sulfatase maturation enzyme AslB (radical SAM superfamily)